MKQAVRARPAIFRALGQKDPPRQLEVGGQPCELQEIFKHDSWAATARYRGPSGSFVIKFNRSQPILLIPMAWLGCCLARREARAYQMLAGLEGVPPAAGKVSRDRRILRTAVAHEYIEGHPLAMDERPGKAFFDELETLVAAIHAKGMAYVDLNKRENIIVTEQSRPLLVDYQIHFAVCRWMAWIPPVRWLLHELPSGRPLSFTKAPPVASAGPGAGNGT